MSGQRDVIHITELIFCLIFLAPVLVLGFSYFEYTVSGTHRVQQAFGVDRAIHALDAMLR
jgi:hypothetical protein